MINLSHKIRMYPNKEQEVALYKACGVARFTWNWNLAEWQRQYKVGEKHTALSLRKQWNEYKKELFPWVYESPSSCNQAPFAHLDKAFKGFFDRKRGFPKFKKKSGRQSFYLASHLFHLSDDNVVITKIGSVKLADYINLKKLK